MIQIVQNKFFSQWGNGNTFASNLTDFATHLKGSVGEKLRVETTVRLGISSEATQQDPFFLDNGDKIRRNSGSWIKDGFQIGQTLIMINNYRNGSENLAFYGTVSAISDLEITLTAIGGGSFVTGEVFDRLFIAANLFNGLNFNFGFVENNAAPDFLSPYSGDLQGYYIDNISSSYQSMLKVGGSSASHSWESGGAKVKYVASTDPTGVATANWLHEYVVQHEFIINPLFIENYTDALNQKMKPEIFKGDNSIKYIADYDFRLVLTNPNTKLVAQNISTLGSVAWLNENYNGFTNNYLIGGLDYEDSTNSNILDGLQKNRKTKVSGSIISALNSFTTTSKVGVYHAMASSEAQYQALQNSYQKTFLHDSIIDTMIAGSISGVGAGIIKTYKFEYVAANSINFEFEIEYSAPQKETILNENNYILAIQVGNANNTDTSDKILLQLDFRNYIINNDVADLLEYENERFVLHPNSNLTNGNTDYKGWLQDGTVLKFDINLNKVLNANLAALRCKLVAYNPTTKKMFELQSYNYSLAGIVQVSAIISYQMFNFNGNRGFKLPQGDNFNNVKLEFNVPVSNIQNINVEYAFKFDWQKWIKLPNADTIFYDNSKESKGLGKDASRYSMLNGYEIRALIEADVHQLTSDFTTYQNLSPTLNIQDFGTDGNMPNKWSYIIETFDELGNDLGGAILKTANTLVRTTWTPTSGTTSEYFSYWAVHRIDDFKSTGYNSIEEMSSERVGINNIFKPLAGETKLKTIINPTNVITECLADFSKLSNNNYTLSARLGVKIQYPRYGDAKDFKFLDEYKTEAILFNGGGYPVMGSLTNSLRWAKLDENYNIVSENAILLDQSKYYTNIRFAVDFNEVVNGKSVFYMLQNSSVDSNVYRFEYNGTTFIQTLIFTDITLNANCIRIDNQLAPNGKAYLWIGSSTSTNYTQIYFNGTSWVNSQINVFDVGDNNSLKFPQDILFIDDKLYLFNKDVGGGVLPQNERGKIGVFEQNIGDPTDPTDRTNFANYIWLYDMYRNNSGGINVDGIGNASDMAFGAGMEILELDVNNNPTILMIHNAKTDYRHFSRIYPITITPASSADFIIQTPMKWLTGQYANYTQLSGKAGSTYYSSKIKNTYIANCAIIDKDSWILGGITQFHFTRFMINDWTGNNNKNEWYICTPLDDEYTFTSGNILKR